MGKDCYFIRPHYKQIKDSYYLQTYRVMGITLFKSLQCNLGINMLLIIDLTTLRCSLQKHVTCVLL